MVTYISNHQNFIMKKIIFVFLLTFTSLSLMAKKQARAEVITLEGDTLTGTIKVPKSFFKGKWGGYAYLQQKIVFTTETGMEKIYKPDQVQGFIILNDDGTSEKFISATGGHEEIEKKGLNWSGFNDKQFMGRGVEAVTLINYEAAFVRVIEEEGYLKRYEYYEDQSASVPFYDPTDPFDYIGLAFKIVAPSLSLSPTHIIRKGNGPFLILNQLKKKRRQELVSFLGGCTKLKNVLNAKKLDVFNDLSTIIMTYNYWYFNEKENQFSE